MAVVLFEDEFVSQLSPIIWTRPAYTISCAGTTLAELIEPLREPIHAIARGYLQNAEKRERPRIDWRPPPLSQSLLLLNARLVPSQTALHWLRQLLTRSQPAAACQQEQLLAAWFPTGVSKLPNQNWSACTLDALSARQTVEQLHADDLELFHYPHDVIRCHEQYLHGNLEARLREPSYREVADGVFAQDGCIIRSSAAFETRRGPVLLDSGATIEHHTVLRGPLRVGHQARVNEGASVKDAVSLGAHTRVGGEVMNSIIEAYSNKQHGGFLGHSYVGSWVNLGAGTSVSNLKNTYGSIRVQLGARKVDTGMQFLGVVMGDHVKTAINTSIFTGKLIGVASHLYGFVTANVPSFVNYAPQLGSVTAIPVEVIAAGQQRVLLRRNVIQCEEDVKLLHEVFQRTQAERSGLPIAPPAF